MHSIIWNREMFFLICIYMSIPTSPRWFSKSVIFDMKIVITRFKVMGYILKLYQSIKMSKTSIVSILIRLINDKFKGFIRCHTLK